MSVRSTRASRIGAGMLSVRSCAVFVTSRNSGHERDGAAIGACQPRFERVAHPAHDEGQWLEPVNRPLEHGAFRESHGLVDRRERALVFPAGRLMQPHAVRPKPRPQIAARQPREIAQRPESPALQNLETCEIRARNETLSAGGPLA